MEGQEAESDTGEQEFWEKRDERFLSRIIGTPAEE